MSAEPTAPSAEDEVGQRLADRVSRRHPGVRSAARWLIPNPNLRGPAAVVSRRFARLAELVLTAVKSDDPALTQTLNALKVAKDWAVCAVLADLEADRGEDVTPS